MKEPNEEMKRRNEMAQPAPFNKEYNDMFKTEPKENSLSENDNNDKQTELPIKNDKLKETWEERVATFLETLQGNSSETNRAALKMFISTLLAEQKARVLELIESKRDNILSSEYARGFHRALDTIKKRINES